MVDREFMADVGNWLPYVRWDRAVIFEDEPIGYAAMYGWIPEGKRFDFVLLQFWFTPDGERQWAWTTSSRKWSPVINEIHEPGSVHNDCQPVQDTVPGLTHMVAR